MGFWSWLFGKKENEYETPKKKRGQVPGVAYGSKPKKRQSPMEFEVKKPEPVVEFDSRFFEFAELKPNSVLVRRKKVLSPAEAEAAGRVSTNCYGPYYEPDPSAPWIEYRTTYGVAWLDKDGERLTYDTESMLYRKLEARKLF